VKPLLEERSNARQLKQTRKKNFVTSGGQKKKRPRASNDTVNREKKNIRKEGGSNAAKDGDSHGTNYGRSRHDNWGRERKGKWPIDGKYGP